jgi:hypothetical protein
MVEAVSCRLSTAMALVRSRVSICGICGAQSDIGQVVSEYFGFPCQFSFHLLLHTHHLLSGADTVARIVTDIPSGLSRTPPQEAKETTAYLTAVVRFSARARDFSQLHSVKASCVTHPTSYPMGTGANFQDDSGREVKLTSRRSGMTL